MSIFDPGKIPEKYKKLGKTEYIGYGSMGTVYRISTLKTDYALKIIDSGANDSKYNVAKREVNILQHLDNISSVVRVFDIYETEEAFKKIIFILEEYAAPLSEYIENMSLSVSGAVNIVIGIAEAMAGCKDKGIVHLDIRPQNIFIRKDGQVLLGDFGSAMFLNELSGNDRMRGTPAYMAPEVYRKNECSIQSDIYSLGVVMYWLLNSARLPFTEESSGETAVYKRLAGTVFSELKTIETEAKPALEAIINKACAYEREDRYQEIEEMLSELKLLWEKIHNGLYSDAIISISENEDDESPSDLERTVRFFDADPLSTTIALFDTEHTDPGTGQPDSCFDSAWDDGWDDPGWGDKENPEPEKRDALRISKVNFSAVAPSSVKKGEYSLINVIMYEDRFRRIVEELIEQSENEVKETRSSAVKVTDGSRIRMIISCPDLEIEEDTEEREWIGEYLDFSFSVMIPESLVKKQILFTVTVYINNIMSTRLKFTANISESQDRQDMEIHREDVMSAYLSYADEDKNRALRIIQGVKLIRPDMDIFLNADVIRARKDYEYAVKKEIDYRDVLYLCWSGFAKRSKEVESEWRYALEHKGITGIEALPLELPSNCPPPKELNGKHFNDKIFFHMNEDRINVSKDKIQISYSVCLDKAARLVLVKGIKIGLTPLEYNMLECLAENMGRIMTVDTLLQSVWGDEYYEGTCDKSSVRRIIKQLRKKIGQDTIETNPGIGYMIPADTTLKD